MAFTRFHDDPARIQKQIDESSFLGKYMLNTPGQGIDLPYIEDPQVRLQRWGANIMTNPINLESDLFGLSRPLNRDDINQNDYKTNSAITNTKSFHKKQPFVDESRASHPSWMYRDLEQTRWETPILNPLANLERPFHHNIQTRILEKDNFTTKIPMINNNRIMNNHQYYLSGSSICLGGNKCI